jgi:hypothetical protein
MDPNVKKYVVSFLIIFLLFGGPTWAEKTQKVFPETVSSTRLRALSKTIYKIQYTTDPGPDDTFPSPLLGSMVTITGVVTADHATSPDHFYIQDADDPFGTGGAWNGIYVCDMGSYNPAMGDEVTITARVRESEGRTELGDIVSYTLVGSSNPLPDPVEVYTRTITVYSEERGEPYEGVLVRADYVVVTDPGSGDGDWRINDGTGTAQVDEGEQYTYKPQLGDYLQWVQGCLDYSEERFEIEPRSDDDIGDVQQFVICNDDNGAPEYVEEVGEWETANVGANCPGINNLTSRYSFLYQNPDACATFTPDIPLAGFYRIEFALPLSWHASPDALYIVRPGGAAHDTVWIDQRSDYGCEWRLLGVYYLVEGRNNSVVVLNDGKFRSLWVLRTDLMRFTPCFPVPVESVTPVAELPEDFALFQNYPNPFNANTEIRYQIAEDGHMTLKVFNTLGQEVKILLDSEQKAGDYVVIWDGRDERGREVASGLYFCRLQAGNISKTIKMVLVR